MIVTLSKRKSAMRKILVLLFSIFFISSCGSSNSNIALGTLERDRIIHKATASEFIVSLPTKEGTNVKTGELLVQLDTTRQQAKVALANAEILRASSALEQLRNGARKEEVDAARAKAHGAQANLALAEKNYQRARQLLEQNLTSQADLDRALGEKDSAEAAFEQTTKALLTLTNGTRREELEQGEAILAAAQAQLQLEQYQLEELSVRATRDGYLDSLPWNIGERVQLGSTVAVMLASSGPFARVYIPEPWRSKIQAGQNFQINIDGQEKPFTGSLRWVSNEPSFTPYYALNKTDRARLVYLAEIDIENADELPSGIPVEMLLGE